MHGRMFEGKGEPKVVKSKWWGINFMLIKELWEQLKVKGWWEVLIAHVLADRLSW